MGAVPAFAEDAAPAAAPPASELSSQRTLAAGRSVSSTELDRVIEDVISRREYSWRLPRVRAPRPETPGLIARCVDGILESLQRWLTSARRIGRDVVDWLLRTLFKQMNQNQASGNSAGNWIAFLQVLLYVLLAVVVGAMAVLLWRTWKRRSSRDEPVLAEAIPSVPDLSDQSVTADQMPEEGWLRLAQELLARGERRLGLRAFYLGMLAHLGRRDLIRIAKFKSNREYQVELRRRSPAEAALQAAFADSVGIFDRVWYGTDEVSDELLAQFQRHQERIIAC
jgi:hypothetical protein